MRAAGLRPLPSPRDHALRPQPAQVSIACVQRLRFIRSDSNDVADLHDRYRPHAFHGYQKPRPEMISGRGFRLDAWAWVELNYRPHAYQAATEGPGIRHHNAISLTDRAICPDCRREVPWLSGINRHTNRHHRSFMRPPKAHSAKRSKPTAWSTNWPLETLTAQWDGSRTLWPPQAAHLQSQRFFQLQLASPERSGDRLHPVPSARGHGEPETPERGSCSNQDSCRRLP